MCLLLQKSAPVKARGRCSSRSNQVQSFKKLSHRPLTHITHVGTDLIMLWTAHRVTGYRTTLLHWHSTCIPSGLRAWYNSRPVSPFLKSLISRKYKEAWNIKDAFWSMMVYPRCLNMVQCFWWNRTHFLEQVRSAPLAAAQLESIVAGVIKQ